MDIIDSYSKLSLGKYAEIQALTKDDTIEEVDKVVGIIAILTDKAEEDILHLPIHEFTELSSKIGFLSAEGFQTRLIAKKYLVGKWELIPVTDYRKLETCQYIDFKTYASDMDNHLVELLSVILVPKGHRYNDGYDIIELQGAIREGMSVADGVTVVAFFLTLFKGLIVDSLTFSKEATKGIKDKEKREEILKKIKEVETRLETSGDGSPA